MDLLYIAFIFFVFALLLAVFGPMFGLGGSGTAMTIAKIFVGIFILLLLIRILLGVGGSGFTSFGI